MKSDLASKLQSAMRGVIPPKTGVAGVTGVADVAATCAKLLRLQRLRPLRVKNTKLENDVILGVACGVAAPPEPDEVEIEERKGMAMGGVPERFLDAWAHLQVQKPHQVSDDGWRQAIDDAGQFFDQGGSLAADFGWTPGDLFDVPRIDGTCGLVWFLKGTRVHGLGPDHAVLGNGTRAGESHGPRAQSATRPRRARRIYEGSPEIPRLNGLSYRDIAEITGVPLGTVMSDAGRGFVSYA
jgi:hypothetical protein